MSSNLTPGVVRIVYSPRYLDHENPPETSARLRAIIEYTERNGLPVEFEEPKNINESDLLLIHSRELIDELKARSAREMSKLENPFAKNTFELAKLACGGALRAAEIAEENGFSFALVRPPGHHAGRDFFHGFCYLNNIAFAVRKAWRGRRVLVVDIDVHLGDGTHDIFLGADDVFYLSHHQSVSTLFPFCPEREGMERNTISMGLEPGTSDREYLDAFRKNLSAAIRKFLPECIAVSAGFDAYYMDRIAALELHTETYRRLGEEIANLDLPTFAVLEGGYYLPDLGRNVWSFISAFL